MLYLLFVFVSYQLSGNYCQFSDLPPANLKYFLPQSGQKKEKFAGLIEDETCGLACRGE